MNLLWIYNCAFAGEDCKYCEFMYIMQGYPNMTQADIDSFHITCFELIGERFELYYDVQPDFAEKVGKKLGLHELDVHSIIYDNNGCAPDALVDMFRLTKERYPNTFGTRITEALKNTEGYQTFLGFLDDFKIKERFI